MPRNWTLIARLSSTVPHVSRNAKVLVIAVFLIVFLRNRCRLRISASCIPLAGTPTGQVRPRPSGIDTAIFTPRPTQVVRMIFWSRGQDRLAGQRRSVTRFYGRQRWQHSDLKSNYGCQWESLRHDLQRGQRALLSRVSGCGVVYGLSPGKNGWTETILYRFKGGTDGAHPGQERWPSMRKAICMAQH